MIELTLGEVADIVGGTLSGDAGSTVTGSLEFDSRAVTVGGLFLALPGERVDGHDYVATAAAAGAAGAIVTRPVDADVAQIVVADGIEALTALASVVARRLPNTTVIGVTGSSGKTSTKDLLAQVLSTAGPTVAPPGSFNNELGHPYTVLRAGLDTRFLVLETSARGVGHIRHLTGIAPPHIGVVLNVGSAHLGEFGSREAIAQAKGELVEALPADGLAVLNADDPLVLAMRSRTEARVVTVGAARAPDAAGPTSATGASGTDIGAADVRLDELGRASFTLVVAGERTPVRLRLVGGHHVGNALAVAAVALECGLPVGDVAAALSAAVPASRWRMEITERPDGVLVVNDAYNANPESMRAALTTLATIGRARAAAGGRSFAVLGEMAELGADAAAEHEALGRLARELGITHVLAVGEAARPITRGAALEGFEDENARWTPDVQSAIALLRHELRGPDAVLVKASRAASLERVAEAVAQDGGPVEPSSGTRDGRGGAA